MRHTALLKQHARGPGNLNILLNSNKKFNFYCNTIVPRYGPTKVKEFYTRTVKRMLASTCTNTNMPLVKMMPGAEDDG